MAKREKNNISCDLSKNVQASYLKLVSKLEKYPDSYWQDNLVEWTDGKRSIADILAYQIGWGKLLLSWYTAGINNITPIMPGEGFTKWDYTGLAKLFYKKYHFASYKKQKQKFLEVVTEIIKMVEKENQTGNLEKIDVWPWCTLPSGKQWPSSKWVQVNTVAPYKRAYSSIKKTLK